ncbi:MAG: hypothetical protein QM490_02370, partial [Candidatus Gracilibacteria bacterium]
MNYYRIYIYIYLLLLFLTGCSINGVTEDEELIIDNKISAEEVDIENNTSTENEEVSITELGNIEKETKENDFIDNDINMNYLKEIEILIAEGKNIEAEERYKELLDEYPDHVGIQEGYESFKIQNNDNISMNYLEEIEILIAEGKSVEVEERYKELLDKYPDHV